MSEKEDVEKTEKTDLPQESVEEFEIGEDELLLPRDVLLSAGIHIGTRMKTKDMNPFLSLIHI